MVRAVIAENKRHKAKVAAAKKRINDWWINTNVLITERRTREAVNRIQEAFVEALISQRSLKESACCIIQNFWRQKIQWAVSIEKIKKQERSHKAAHHTKLMLFSLISKHWKTHKRRAITRREELEKREAVSFQISCILLIQTLWRRHSAMLFLQQKRRCYRVWRLLINGAVLMHYGTFAAAIQRRMRLLQWKKRRLHAIITLQSCVRSYHYRKLRSELANHREKHAAQVLQQSYRKYAAKLAQKRCWDERHKASSTIQSIFMSHLRKKRFQEVARHMTKQRRKESIMRKEQMLSQRQANRLMAITDRRDNFAAASIQRMCGSFLSNRRQLNEQCVQAELERLKIEEEEERLREVTKRNKERKKITKRAEKYANNLSQLLNKDNLQRIGATLKNVAKRIPLHSTEAVGIDNDELLAEYRVAQKNEADLNVAYPLEREKIAKAIQERTIEVLKKFNWFDERLHNLVNSYGLTAKDVLHLHEIFRRFDYGASGCAYTVDFFDDINEEKTFYGMWLFAFIGTESDLTLSFSEYAHIVIFFGMLGKQELAQFMFSCADDLGRKYLEKKQWEKLLVQMVSHESIRPSTRPAIKAFEAYAVPAFTEGFVLFFEGFVKVKKLCSVHKYFQFLIIAYF